MKGRRIGGIGGALALAAASLAVLGSSPAGAVPVGDETSFRAAWDTGTAIELTADITLTCANGGEAERSSHAAVVLDGMGHTIRMESGCIERVLGTDGDGATTLRNVTITGGRTSSDGGGYEHDGNGPLTLDRVTIVDNIGCSEGGGVEVEEDVPVTVIGSTFTANVSGSEGALDMDTGGDLLIVNSTFTGNVANQNGAVYGEDGAANTMTIVYSTIVANIETEIACVVSTDPDDAVDAAEVEAEDEDGDVAPQAAGEAANVDMGSSYTLHTFGTVIALPQGNGTPTPNCGVLANVPVSSGYNFSDDATCGFTNTAAGDRQNAGNPQVGALANNGGPTQTRLPADTSPLVNFIPLAACGGGDTLAGFAVTTDQRGIARPQATGCEIGSVELLAAVVVVPRFAG